jgi:hypothetical protein
MSRRRRERIETAAALAKIGAPPEIVEGTIILLTRCGPLFCDGDNLAGSFKSIRDAVCEWLGVDDGARSPVRFEYRQVRVRERRAPSRFQPRPGFRIFARVAIEHPVARGLAYGWTCELGAPLDDAPAAEGASCSAE